MHLGQQGKEIGVISCTWSMDTWYEERNEDTNSAVKLDHYFVDG